MYRLPRFALESCLRCAVSSVRVDPLLQLFVVRREKIITDRQLFRNDIRNGRQARVRLNVVSSSEERGPRVILTTHMTCKTNPKKKEMIKPLSWFTVERFLRFPNVSSVSSAFYKTICFLINLEEVGVNLLVISITFKTLYSLLL